MWVREQEEHFGELHMDAKLANGVHSNTVLQYQENKTYLALLEKVGKKLHSIHSHDRNVLILSRILGSESFDAFIDIFFNLQSNFHA
jgi:hypothetical protein